MGSFSGLGIGLSFVFGCILMGLVGELYYLLWWKRRISTAPEIEGSCFLFTRRRPANHPQPELDPEGASVKGFGEEGIEMEIMRMHNLPGPPRFLCTIKEESKEDLESEDGKRSRKGSRTRSLSDLFVTPLSSPSIKANPCLLDSCNGDVGCPNHGFNNPLFEEVSGGFGLRSSPPPKFKFLKDAEDKLVRKMEMERKLRGLV